MKIGVGCLRSLRSHYNVSGRGGKTEKIFFSPNNPHPPPKRRSRRRSRKKGMDGLLTSRWLYKAKHLSLTPNVSYSPSISETRPCCLTLQSLSPQDHDTRCRRMKAVIRSPQVKREKSTSPATKTCTNTAQCFVSPTAVLSSSVMMM